MRTNQMPFPVLPILLILIFTSVPPTLSACTLDGGGTFDSYAPGTEATSFGWTAESTSQTTNFATDVNGKLSIGATTAATPVVISQPLSAYTRPVENTLWFSAEFTKVLPNDDPYRVSVQYFDSNNALVAEFGLQDDHIFAASGGISGISPTSVVQLGTYYWLFGKIDAASDTLTVWANPSKLDVSNMTNYAVQLTNLSLVPEQVQGLTTRKLYAQTITDGSRKTLDDLEIMVDPDYLSLPHYNFKAGTSNVQPGFELWDASSSLTITHEQSDLGGGNPVTITVSPIPGGGPVQVSTRTSLPTGGDQIGNALRESGVKALGGIQLEFHGFIEDDNFLKSYSYGDVGTIVDVWSSSTGLDGSFTYLGSFTQGSGTSAATEFRSLMDTRTSSGEYYLRFISQDPLASVELNGFKVTPEPSTLALAGAALVGILFAAMRKRAN